MSAFGRIVPALVICVIALALPAFASAVTYEVDVTGDSDTQAVCEAATPGCTLRGAILAANASAAVADEIVFAAAFDGEIGDTISPATPLPEILSPTRIDGGICSVSGAPVPCVTIKGITGFGTISVRADESTIENLRIDGGGVGIRAIASGTSNPGVGILRNTIVNAGNGIEVTGSIGGTGNLIEGNKIEVLLDNNAKGIAIVNGPNRVFGNILSGSCCLSGIFLSGTASGNRIGGDTAASENVINGFQNGPIALILPESTRNEIGRNRGENGSKFINLGPNSANGGIDPPAIDSPLQSSASGTAEPGAKVRVFRKATEWEGEIESFLAEAVADPSGKWKATFAAAIPVGTFVTATQTLDGGTSELAAAATTAADPPTPPDPPDPPDPPTPPTCANTPSICVKPDTPGSPAPPAPGPAPTPAPAAPADVRKPVVTIKKAPKAKSTATTATFKFVSDEAGSAFQCKLDKKAWAKCASPKTYRNLKLGKHVFKVKATDAAGNVSAVVTRRFTVLA